MNFRSGKSFGYAFVNFQDHSTALTVFDALNGCQEEEGSAMPALAAEWSNCQGLDANIEHWRNNSVMHRVVPFECKPALYDKEGKQIKFPPPTKAISKPRVHWASKDLVPDNE